MTSERSPKRQHHRERNAIVNGRQRYLEEGFFAFSTGSLAA
jgi:hypothetical protein